MTTNAVDDRLEALKARDLAWLKEYERRVLLAERARLELEAFWIAFSKPR